MKSRVLVIAEAGVNHNGDITIAKKMIKVAAESGADYVKFQTFNVDKLVSKEAKLAYYQKINLNQKTLSQYNMLKKLEIPINWYSKLIDYANEKKIKFLSTGFDEESIDLLNSYKLDFFKIPSGEITNKPYLEHIAKKKKPVLLSTGMSNLEEVGKALSILLKFGLNKKLITVMHCNSEYPTPFEDVNLNAMIDIKNKFDVRIGYSDHTLGVEAPIAAVALGASVIEKHFTLNKKMSGPDHSMSLSPKELKNMITCIRNVEKALSGVGKKLPSKSEEKNKKIVRKSIHTSRPLKIGDFLRKEDCIMLRPGDGISPMEIDYYINKKIINNLPAGYKISKNDFEI